MNATAAEKTPLEVFISYSHKEEALKEELEIHLASLVREGTIAPWQDRDIEAGTEWDAEIKAALESAHVILLLITPRFLASRYCFDEETERAMARHQAGTARVIPIIMKPSDWQTSAFSKLQVLPKDGKPITRWDDQDEAFLDVVKGLRRVLKTLTIQKPSRSNPTPEQAPVNASTPATSAEPAESTSTSTALKRLELFKLLSSLPGPTFDSIVYALNVPLAFMPPPMAPQGQRVPALLNWVQSPVGCGLEALEAVTSSVINA